MLTVWGRPNSSNVQKVMWTIGQLGLDHEHHNVGGSFGGNDAPGYRAMNPTGLVPTLKDGDLVLWESNAIVRYLSATYAAGTFWPTGPADRALADQWFEWGQTAIIPDVMAIFFAIVRTKRADQDLAAVKPVAARVGEKLRLADDKLSGQDFMGGAALGLADIPLGMVIYRYFTLEIKRPALPNLEAWYGRLQDHPAYRTHIMLDFGTCLEEWLEREAKLT